MPKTINPAAKWTDQIDVPRAGEGVKAAGVELPFADVLANTKQLKSLVADLQARVDGLQTGSNSGTDAPDLSAAVAALDTRLDQLEAAASAGNAAGAGTAIDGLSAGLAALITRVAALESANSINKNPADFIFIPTSRDMGAPIFSIWFTLLPHNVLANAKYDWQITTLNRISGTVVE